MSQPTRREKDDAADLIGQTLSHYRIVSALGAGPKRFYSIPGASHNDTYVVGGEAYWHVVSDFLETLPPVR